MTLMVRAASAPPPLQFLIQFSNSRIVIASEAKQSILQHKERMDCFAALAMTFQMQLRVLATRGSLLIAHAIGCIPRFIATYIRKDLAMTMIACGWSSTADYAFRAFAR